MVSEMFEDLRLFLGVVRIELEDLSAELNLTMRAVGNQIPAGDVVQLTR